MAKGVKVKEGLQTLFCRQSVRVSSKRDLVAILLFLCFNVIFQKEFQVCCTWCEESGVSWSNMHRGKVWIKQLPQGRASQVPSCADVGSQWGRAALLRPKHTSWARLTRVLGKANRPGLIPAPSSAV